MALTKEQEAILGPREPEMLVVAGAGTGKTHTLVGRYLDLLAEHAPSALVAVTFTEAAATEMRERVRRKLEERWDLAHHRAVLDEAPIGTIHALCLRILLEHAAEAGIDPASRILGEDEAEYEVLLACVDALEAASTDERAATAILELSDEAGPEKVANLLSDLVRDRDDVRAAFALMGETREDFEAFAREACDRAVEPLRARLLALAPTLDPVSCRDPGDKLFAFWWDTREALARLPADPQEFREAVAAIAEGLRSVGNAGHGRNWTPDPKTVRGYLFAIRHVAREAANVGWNEHDPRAVEVTFALRRLFDLACATYEARKRSLAALDYLDLEVKTRDLLRDAPGVAAAYHARFRHLLVDEFQDTNPIQVEIVALLAGDGDPPPVARFYVGDAKQAIYRFRGGDVRAFNRVHRRLAHQADRVFPLSKSFRAHGSLVEIINDVFEEVFEPAEDERADYEAEMGRLTGRDGSPPRAPHVVVLRVADPADGSTADEGDRTRFEAFLVAQEIKALLDSGREIWDRDEGMRPVRPSDIAILLRRFKKVREFEDALAVAGVPAGADQGAGFFERPEIVDLANLLGWLAEPDDEIALVGALRSPLFLIDDPTLFVVREQRRPFLLALREPPVAVLEPQRSVCLRAAAILEELQALAANEGVDAILARALALTGFEAAWAALPAGGQAVANIAKLLDLARSLRSRSLDEFVTYLVRRRDELTTRESQAVLDRADAVRILTVHRSKGLEFPVVFIAEADIQNRLQRENVVRNHERGVSVTLPGDDGEPGSARLVPGFCRVLREGEDREDLAEFRRLFYVACTRAGDYLYLAGDESKNPSERRWLDWALGVLGGVSDGRVEIRPAAPVDMASIRRAAPAQPVLPAEEAERDYVAPLLARPPVIPVRTSTPVTALLAERDHPLSGHGDGLAAFRGTVAHRAIELTYGARACPPLRELVAQMQDRPLPAADADRLAAEIEGYLERFAGSELGRRLASGSVEARYEAPFAWDWDGVPVHGTIDLVYRDGQGSWHVVDFKTDAVEGRSPAAAAEPYLAQLGLYGMALERAVGARPSLALAFLRTGIVHAVEWGEVEPAVAEARRRVDAGVELAVEGVGEDEG